jgi:hypothetical protein
VFADWVSCGCVGGRLGRLGMMIWSMETVRNSLFMVLQVNQVEKPIYYHLRASNSIDYKSVA